MNRFRRLVHRHQWQLWGYTLRPMNPGATHTFDTAGRWDICPQCLQLRYVRGTR